jgi:peptidyl-prolyl cis-trans isomerase SurA
MGRAAWRALVALALAVPLAELPAQTGRQLVDRVVAIVGERVILLSELDEEILQQRAQGLQIPDDSAAIAALRRQVLERLVDEEVLYQRARADTAITVSDGEIQNGVDEQFRRVRGQFTSETEFRTQLSAAGWGTPEEYRRWLADQQRRAEYQRRYIERLRQEGKLRSVTVSESELRRAFEEASRSGTIPRRPPTVSFTQIVVAPRPSGAAWATAQAQAESAIVELRRGTDFASLARRLSDDPTTRELGGDLGWFRRGMMVRAFEEAAFRLRPGQTSGPVLTQYGVHLIHVERVQPAEVKARHILFAPAVTDDQLAAASRLADSLAFLVRGGASADSLARVHGDTTEPRSVGPVDRGQLTRDYLQAFEGASVGDVAGPFATNTESRSRTRFVVAEVTDVQPERPYSFEEVRERLRASLGQEGAVRQLLTSLRRQMYVDVRL